MANAEVVIKIPEEMYKTIKGDLYNTFPSEWRKWGLEAIRNGIRIPKSHGDLIDRRELKKDVYTATEWNGDVHRIIYEANVDDAPTIIEADNDISSYPSSTITESHYTGQKYYAYWCPNCSKNVDKLTSKYVCRYCGQKLKWEV